MPPKVKPIPKGYHTVTPILMVDGGAALIEFLERAFGAKVKDRFMNPSGRIAHAEVMIGDSIVQLSDAEGEWKSIQVPLLVYVPDTDSAYQEALKAGATSVRPPVDTFYGDRTAGVKDRFGNTWWLATRIEDVSQEELHRRAEAEWKKDR